MPEAEARLSSTGRVEAFSDGVMSIAITLLVLDLRVPPTEEVTEAGSLLNALVSHWTSYVAYLAAFLTIGIIWLNHAALVDAIARFDRRLRWLNLMLLLGVATIPFPTALMAEYVERGGAEASTAAALYGLLALVLAFPWRLMWRHLRDRPELLEAGYGPTDAEAAIRRNLWGPLVYGSAVVVALVAPLVALGLYVAIALFFAGIRQPARPGLSGSA